MGRKIIGASKVSSKFQVTIPEDVRKRLGIAVGDTIAFIQEDDRRVFITTKVS